MVKWLVHLGPVDLDKIMLILSIVVVFSKKAIGSLNSGANLIWPKAGWNQFYKPSTIHLRAISSYTV